MSSRALLAILILIPTLAASAAAAPIDGAFRIPGRDDLRLKLTLYDDRTIQGGIFHAGSKVAGVTGSNLSPGMIRLKFHDASTPVPQDEVQFRRVQEEGSTSFFWRASNHVQDLPRFEACEPPETCPEETSFDDRILNYRDRHFDSEGSATFRFAHTADWRMRLTADRDRKLTGRVYDVRNGNEIASVVGESKGEKQISLSFRAASGVLRDATILYRFEVPNSKRAVRAFVTEGETYWRTDDQSSPVANFIVCELSRCPEFPERFDSFDTRAGWETNLFGHAIGEVQKQTTRKEADRAARILRKHFRATVEWQKNRRNEGWARLGVPPGMEEEALRLLQAAGVKGFEVGYYPRGSTILACTFKAGAFLDGVVTTANLRQQVARLRERNKSEFTALGFSTEVTQAGAGGLAFVVTLVMYSTARPGGGDKVLLEKVPGVWIKTRMQLLFSSRDEAGAPGDRVDLMQAYVVDSRVYRAPIEIVPNPNARWVTFEIDNSRSDSSVLDNDLNLTILDALATRLEGTCSDMS